jgi:hypothetical protein
VEGVVTIVLLVVVVTLLVDEHVLPNARGIQMGTKQQLFRTHTDVFDAHAFVLVQASNNEQSI